MPILKCIPPTKVEHVMRVIHKGICGNHAEEQSLAFKTLSQDYYWPIMKAN